MSDENDLIATATRLARHEKDATHSAARALHLQKMAARIAELEAELNAWRSELLVATGGHATTPKLAAEIVRQLRGDLDAVKGTK